MLLLHKYNLFFVVAPRKNCPYAVPHQRSSAFHSQRENTVNYQLLGPWYFFWKQNSTNTFTAKILNDFQTILPVIFGRFSKIICSCSATVICIVICRNNDYMIHIICLETDLATIIWCALCTSGKFTREKKSPPRTRWPNFLPSRFLRHQTLVKNVVPPHTEYKSPRRRGPWLHLYLLKIFIKSLKFRTILPKLLNEQQLGHYLLIPNSRYHSIFTHTPTSVVTPSSYWIEFGWKLFNDCFSSLFV